MRSRQTHRVCADQVCPDAPRGAAESSMIDFHKFIFVCSTDSVPLPTTARTNDPLVNHLAKWKATGTHWKKAAGGDPYWESANYLKSQAQLDHGHRFDLFFILKEFNTSDKLCRALCANINEVADCPIAIFAKEVLNFGNNFFIIFVWADHLKDLL